MTYRHAPCHIHSPPAILPCDQLCRTADTFVCSRLVRKYNYKGSTILTSKRGERVEQPSVKKLKATQSREILTTRKVRGRPPIIHVLLNELDQNREREREREGWVESHDGSQKLFSFFPLTQLTVLSFTPLLQHGSISTARIPASSCWRNVRVWLVAMLWRTCV